MSIVPGGDRDGMKVEPLRECPECGGANPRSADVCRHCQIELKVDSSPGVDGFRYRSIVRPARGVFFYLGMITLTVIAAIIMFLAVCFGTAWGLFGLGSGTDAVFVGILAGAVVATGTIVVLIRLIMREPRDEQN